MQCGKIMPKKSLNYSPLREIRESIPMNQINFAEKIGCSVNTIFNIETDRMKLSPDIAKRIFALTGCQLAWEKESGNPVIFACDWKGEPYTKDSYKNWRKFTESFSEKRAKPRLNALTILFHNILMGSIRRKKFLTIYLECLDFFKKLIETHGLEDSMNRVIQNAETYFLFKRNIETGKEIRKNVPEMLTTLRLYSLPGNQEIEELFDEKDKLSSDSSFIQSHAEMVRDVGLGYATVVNRKGKVCKVPLF